MASGDYQFDDYDDRLFEEVLFEDSLAENDDIDDEFETRAQFIQSSITDLPRSLHKRVAWYSDFYPSFGRVMGLMVASGVLFNTLANYGVESQQLFDERPVLFFGVAGAYMGILFTLGIYGGTAVGNYFGKRRIEKLVLENPEWEEPIRKKWN